MSDTYSSFGMVQLDAASKATLGKEANLRDDKLVQLSEAD